jgi:hypothetical protein
MMEPRLIQNTKVFTTHDWPEGMFIQGGEHGLVITGSEGENYTTAFVEAFPDTFIRGEGKNITEAENSAWEQYQKVLSCGTHEYETRGYTNGAGFCKKCKQFQSKVFTGEELGQFCIVCGVGTTYSCYSDKAYWDTEMGWVRDPAKKEDKVKWYCEEHKLFRAEKEAYDDIPQELFSLEAMIAVLEILGGKEGVTEKEVADE